MTLLSNALDALDKPMTIHQTVGMYGEYNYACYPDRIEIEMSLSRGDEWSGVIGIVQTPDLDDVIVLHAIEGKEDAYPLTEMFQKKESYTDNRFYLTKNCYLFEALYGVFHFLVHDLGKKYVTIRDLENKGASMTSFYMKNHGIEACHAIGMPRFISLHNLNDPSWRVKELDESIMIIRPYSFT